MREILFRGKRVDNGEWVEGGYYVEKVGDYITSAFIVENLTDEVTEAHRVYPESIGQFTSLRDKNGKKIFEGDILCCTSIYMDHKSFGEVQSEIWNCGCCNDVYGFSILGDINLSKCEHYKIVGNTYDNPELLKGENDA